MPSTAPPFFVIPAPTQPEWCRSYVRSYVRVCQQTDGGTCHCGRGRQMFCKIRKRALGGVGGWRKSATAPWVVDQGDRVRTGMRPLYGRGSPLIYQVPSHLTSSVISTHKPYLRLIVRLTRCNINSMDMRNTNECFERLGVPDWVVLQLRSGIVYWSNTC